MSALRGVAGASRVPTIRPRPRPVELGLLTVVALALVVGGASLGATERWLKAQAAGEKLSSFGFAPPDPRGLAVYLGALLLVHLAFVLSGRRTDQILLPAVAMLGGIGLLLMQRLPQSLVTQSVGSLELRLGQRKGG